MDFEAACPYCGEPVTLAVDDGGGPSQQYIEDCSVCCQPIDVRASLRGDDLDVTLRRTDD